MRKAKKILAAVLMVMLFTTCFTSFALGLTNRDLRVFICQTDGVYLHESADDDSPAYGLLWTGDKFNAINPGVTDKWYYGSPGAETNIAQFYAPSIIHGYVKAAYFNVY